jgi:outer membrane immunogenic protein
MKTGRLVCLALALGLASTGLALSADLPAKSPAMTSARVVANVPHWTGIYIGAHVGWAWVEEERTEIFDPSGGFPAGFRFCCDRDGVIGGAQAGLNWQTGNWVWGIEGDWSWTGSRKEVVSVSTINGETRNSFAKDKWHATAAARLGHTFGNWLVYVKGGAGFLNADRGATLTNVPATGTVVVGTRNDTFAGWLVGGGLEYALGTNWSAKAELSYTDFGSNQRHFSVPAAADAVEQFETQVYMVKLGVNYRFAAGY